MVQKCCCCIRLRVGTILIALIVLGTSILGAYTALEFVDTSTPFSTSLGYINGVWHIVKGIICIGGLYGAYSQDKRLVHLFAVIISVTAMIHLVFGIGLVVIGLKNQDKLVDLCLHKINVTSSTGGSWQPGHVWMDSFNKRADSNTTTTSTSGTTTTTTSATSTDNTAACQTAVKWYLAVFITVTIITVILTFYFAAVAYRYRDELDENYKRRKLDSDHGPSGLVILDSLDVIPNFFSMSTDGNETAAFDDDLTLSAHALSALNEFFSEQQEQQIKFEQLKQRSLNSIQNYLDTERKEFVQEDSENILTKEKDEKEDVQEVNMNYFKEDWQLSQFWYDDETTDVIIQEILDNTNSDSQIACISTPTVFVKLKSMTPLPTQSIRLFEFDTRFDIYGKDFIQYDYKTPTKFRDSSTFQNAFDFIVVDPPFLSEDCCVKTMITVKWLGKKEGCKFLVCTGAVMRDLVNRLVKARMTTFYPRHKGGLANEFRCYREKKSSITISEDERAASGYKSFRMNYLAVYFLVMAGDWLQGPYIYALYKSHGFNLNQIAILFVTGFLSSGVFGVIVGSAADKYTFSYATFGNGLVAIVCGLIANLLVKKCNVTTPFLAAIGFFSTAASVIATTWKENFGNEPERLNSLGDSSFLSQALKIINKVGVIQSLFEASMYTFIFIWGPLLEHFSAELPFGIIFASFMVAIMIGSLIYSHMSGTQNISLSAIANLTLFTASVSLLIPIFFQSELILFISFTVFEATCGIYFPLIGTFRAKVVPEHLRATIANLFRVPLNLIVVTLL
ncbi:8720_t:CDS:10 [Acaulospora morrowiae]|uniref:Protein-lysine N-methyltransferase EFM5 n=1 Tax=Acaulospora morrowiae TaxID=94023 RepID=A0A9N8ZQE1_9GLOM|nr:8720_t:CDS:10 [Acaulospora morrowiae]